MAAEGGSHISVLPFVPDDKRIRCHVCKLKFESATVLRTHVEAVHPGQPLYKCGQCGLEFKGILSYKGHTREHPEVDSEDENTEVTVGKELKIQISGSYIDGDSIVLEPAGDLAQNITEIIIFQDDVTEEPEKNPDPQAYVKSLYQSQEEFERIYKYPCKICGKRYQARNSLLGHVRTHTGEKPFKCKICGKSYRQDNHLRMHEYLHTGEKKFPCHLCGSAFRFIECFKRHVRKQHPGETLYRCDICQQGIDDRIEYRTHMRAHNSEDHVVVDVRIDESTVEGGPPYRCKLCSQVFVNRSAIKRHLMSHSDARPYVCKICGKAFKRDHHLKQHQAKHMAEKPFPCYICGKGIRYLNGYKKHMRTMHAGEPLFKCQFCGHMFSDRFSYNTHLKSHSQEEREEVYDAAETLQNLNQQAILGERRKDTNWKKPVYKCTTCNRTFSEQSFLLEHQRHHGHGVVNQQLVVKPTTGTALNKSATYHKEILRCHVCGVTTQYVNELKKHMKDSHPGELLFKCSMCGMKSNNKAAYNIHIKSHTQQSSNVTQPANRVQNITINDDPFSQVGNLLDHVDLDSYRMPQSIFNTSSDALQQYSQNVPATVGGEKRQYEELKTAAQHLGYSVETIEEVEDYDNSFGGEFPQDTNAELVQAARSVDPKTNPNLQCEVCGKTFASKGSLFRHRRIHSGVKPFQCHICGMSFYRPYQLRNHQTSHTQERQFTCHVCGRAFRGMTGFKKHIRKAHPGETFYKCEVCGEKFDEKKALNLHKYSHSEDFRNPVVRSSIVLEGSKKPVFKCLTCGKIFKVNAQLRIHQRSHTGEKPFKCDKCGKKFTQGAHLKDHTRSCSSENKPNACRLCSQRFKSDIGLMNHIRRNHPGAPVHFCSECNEGFISKVAYNVHYRTLHYTDYTTENQHLLE